jgi:hypothetical protein
VKLSIKAELAYSFADATQIIANIEASDTSDQSILSETLDIQPPAKFLSDKTAYGDRRAGAGDGVPRIMAMLEWIHRNVDYIVGVSNAETTAERTFVDRAGAGISLIWGSPLRGPWEFLFARLAPTPCS